MSGWSIRWGGRIANTRRGCRWELRLRVIREGEWVCVVVVIVVIRSIWRADDALSVVVVRE